MTRIERSALVARPASYLFALVDEVEAYPRRFDWCSDARVLSREGAVLVARLDVRYAGLAIAFTTRNTRHPPERIDLELVDGPFTALSGAWQFRPLGETGCKVGLTLDVELAGRWLGSALALGFQRLADHMVDEFVRVARDAA